MMDGFLFWRTNADWMAMAEGLEREGLRLQRKAIESERSGEGCRAAYYTARSDEALELGHGIHRVLVGGQYMEDVPWRGERERPMDENTMVDEMGDE